MTANSSLSLTTTHSAEGVRCLRAEIEYNPDGRMNVRAEMNIPNAGGNTTVFQMQALLWQQVIDELQKHVASLRDHQ